MTDKTIARESSFYYNIYLEIDRNIRLSENWNGTYIKDKEGDMKSTVTGIKKLVNYVI